MDETTACATCDFFALPVNRMVRGECRRYPRSHAKLIDEWCGEYRRSQPTQDIQLAAEPGRNPVMVAE